MMRRISCRGTRAEVTHTALTGFALQLARWFRELLFIPQSFRKRRHLRRDVVRNPMDERCRGWCVRVFENQRVRLRAFVLAPGRFGREAVGVLGLLRREQSANVP